MQVKINGLETRYVLSIEGGMIAQQFTLDDSSRAGTLAIADTTAGTPPEGRAVWDQRGAQGRHGITGASDIEPLVHARFSGSASRSG